MTITINNIIIILVTMTIIWLVWKYFLRSAGVNESSSDKIRQLTILNNCREIENKKLNDKFDELIAYLELEHFEKSGWDKKNKK